MNVQLLRCAAAAGIILSCAGSIADDEMSSSEIFQLSQPVSLTAVGTAGYAKSTVLSFEDKGRLSFVATPGTQARGCVFNLAGAIVTPGDLLAEQDTAIAESDVKIAEVLVERAEVVLTERHQNYLRDKALIDKNAVSIRQFDETRTLYESAKIDRDKEKLDLERARRVLERCRIRAPFQAVVIESYRVEGASVDVGDEVLKIGMVDPIRISVTLEPKLRPRAAVLSQVTVTASDGTEVVARLIPGEEDGAFYCDLPNPWGVPAATAPDGALLPAVGGLNPVRVLAAPGAPFWVREGTVHQDKEGCFVWKLRENRSQGVTTLDRIAVKALDVQLQFGNGRLRGIESNQLQRGDLLAIEVPETVRPGDPVICMNRHRRFQAGEKLHLRLSAAENGAFFSMPATALHPNRDNSGRHVLAETEPGKFTPIPVTVLETPGAPPMAAAPELRPGMRLRLRH